MWNALQTSVIRQTETLPRKEWVETNNTALFWRQSVLEQTTPPQRILAIKMIMCPLLLPSCVKFVCRKTNATSKRKRRPFPNIRIFPPQRNLYTWHILKVDYSIMNGDSPTVIHLNSIQFSQSVSAEVHLLHAAEAFTAEGRDGKQPSFCSKDLDYSFIYSSIRSFVAKWNWIVTPNYFEEDRPAGCRRGSWSRGRFS